MRKYLKHMFFPRIKSFKMSDGRRNPPSVQKKTLLGNSPFRMMYCQRSTFTWSMLNRMLLPSLMWHLPTCLHQVPVTKKKHGSKITMKKKPSELIVIRQRVFFHPRLNQFLLVPSMAWIVSPGTSGKNDQKDWGWTFGGSDRAIYKPSFIGDAYHGFPERRLAWARFAST